MDDRKLNAEVYSLLTFIGTGVVSPTSVRKFRVYFWRCGRIVTYTGKTLLIVIMMTFMI